MVATGHDTNVIENGTVGKGADVGEHISTDAGRDTSLETSTNQALPQQLTLPAQNETSGPSSLGPGSGIKPVAVEDGGVVDFSQSAVMTRAASITPVKDDRTILRNTNTAFAQEHCETIHNHAASTENVQLLSSPPTVQGTAMMGSETDAILIPDQEPDTTVPSLILSDNRECSVAEDVEAVGAEERQVLVRLEEGEVLQIPSPCVQASNRKDNESQASTFTDYTPLRREEFLRKRELLRRAEQSGLEKSDTQSFERGIEHGHSSFKVQCPIFGIPSFRPPFRNQSPLYVHAMPQLRYEGRREAFEEAKAKGLIPQAMTYSTLLDMDARDIVAKEQRYRSDREAWIAAGKPSKPPGSRNRSEYSHVYDGVVPDVIRGPELKRPADDPGMTTEPQAKRRKIEQESTRKIEAAAKCGLPPKKVKNVNHAVDKEAVPEEKPEKSRFGITRQDVKDWIRLMSGKKRG